MPPLTKDQVQGLRTEIEAGETEAAKFVNINRGYDITFKVGLLIVAILVTILSGIGASDVSWAKNASLAGAILAGIFTLVSGFAHQQFNFQHRQYIWERKKAALLSLKRELMIFKPDAEDFRRRLDSVMEWNESKPPADLPLSKAADITAGMDSADTANARPEKPLIVPELQKPTH